LELLLCFLCFDECLQSKHIAFFMIGNEKFEEFNMFATNVQPNHKNTIFSTGDICTEKMTIMACKITKSPAHQIKVTC